MLGLLCSIKTNEINKQLISVVEFQSSERQIKIESFTNIFCRRQNKSKTNKTEKIIAFQSEIQSSNESSFFKVSRPNKLFHDTRPGFYTGD